jgi:activator of 2-hydroxyglutaryl-CoA dehydratase
VSASTGVIGSIARTEKKGLSDYLNEQLQYFVGLDWGSENHRIVLLNHEGRVIEQYDAAHSGRGLEALVDRSET